MVIIINKRSIWQIKYWNERYAGEILWNETEIWWHERKNDVFKQSKLIHMKHFFK